MKKTIYHGSVCVVKKPIFGFGRKDNDYGLAFYCTDSLELAKEWACRDELFGFANEYEFDFDGLTVLDLTDKSKYNVLNWIAIILHYRDFTDQENKSYDLELKFLDDNYFIDVEKYDVIIGYRADDSYFSFSLSFIKSEFTLERLEEIYKLGDLEEQIVLKSKKAFNNISFIDAHDADETNHEKYQKRMKMAKEKYEAIKIEERRRVDGIRFRDIMFGEKQ